MQMLQRVAYTPERGWHASWAIKVCLDALVQRLIKVSSMPLYNRLCWYGFSLEHTAYSTVCICGKVVMSGNPVPSCRFSNGLARKL